MTQTKPKSWAPDGSSSETILSKQNRPTRFTVIQYDCHPGLSADNNVCLYIL